MQLLLFMCLNCTLCKILIVGACELPYVEPMQLGVFLARSYQRCLAAWYLTELIDEENNLSIYYAEYSRNMVFLKVRWRHVNSKNCNAFIDYVSCQNEIQGIQRYCCDRSKGNKKICSHVTSVKDYMSPEW